MVIIRESPRAKLSPSKSQVQWPPASPFQALLSSPSGRKRWEDLQQHDRSRSKSPSRGPRPTGSLVDMSLPDSDTVDVEDEESLKLELEILETKKKLRDLARKKKDQQDPNSRTQNEQIGSWSPSKRRKLMATRQEDSTQDVQVPLSPSKSQFNTNTPASPARARLGIQNSRAEGVSLKRPSNAAIGKASVAPEPPISSFSQRLASARCTTQEKKDKSDRLNSIRSKTFNQMATKVTSCTPTTTSKRLLDPRPALLESKTGSTLQGVNTSRSTASSDNHKKRANSRDPAYYDPFSDIHLSSRSMSHTAVAKSLTGCEIYTLPRLLKEVKSPEYEPPDCETDYVVFGVLAEKTSPFQQKDNHRIVDRNKNEDNTRMAKNKFMVLRLCDLKWEVDCYLFGTGFEQYWKLTEGTLLAILNPAIMPPKTNQHNGRFSLKVASSEDCIIEVGIARDLGHCKSVKKDGKQCSAWVNKSKSEYCEFHVSLAITRSRKGRMEVNTMWQGYDPEANAPKEKRNPNVSHHPEYGQLWSVGSIGGRSAAGLLDDDDTDALHNLTKDEASQKRIAAQQRERDLARQLGATGGGVAGDYLRAKYGVTTGTSDTSASQGEAMFVKPSAAELGLLSKKADDQRLSPAKDRRRHFGIGAISSAGREAMGWGGSRKTDLLQPKRSRIGSPERGQSTITAENARSILQSPTRARSSSPKKKARFMLDRGMKEPGRESIAHDLLHSRENTTNDDDNDDDDLDIV